LFFRFFDRDGGRLVVDSSSLELVKGATVDYKQVREIGLDLSVEAPVPS